jgi:hypothetical protein
MLVCTHVDADTEQVTGREHTHLDELLSCIPAAGALAAAAASLQGQLLMAAAQLPQPLRCQ